MDPYLARAVRIARRIWNAYHQNDPARVLSDRRGRPNFMVALALARHLVQIERRVRWFNAEDFDIQHLDPRQNQTKFLKTSSAE